MNKIYARKSRLFFALLTGCSLLFVTARAATQSDDISVSVKDVSLAELFKKIQSQSKWLIFYKDEAVAREKKVTLYMVEKPIATVLDKALANTALTYKISGNQVSIVTDPDKSTGPLREENDTLMTIKGRIFDSHEPPTGLPGVTIQVKNSRNGVLGDPDGYFSIKAKKNDVLLFTLMGYKSEEYLVTKSNSNLIIALKDNVAKLDEVVVTGLSEQQKKHIASSLSTLDIGSQIAGKPVTKLSQALQGGITGINVSQGSGLPGGDAAMVKIRGLSTITTNSDPLVLVDGVPMDMNNIDPVTVESVTVLKDAAAAASYGSRGANGVIVVTTKRGTPGKVSVMYDGYYGYQSPSYLSSLVNAPNYMRLYNEALVNDNKPTIFPDSVIANTESGVDPIKYPDTDWQDVIVSKYSPITSHSLSVSGGNNVARFAFTGNYLYQDGMIPVTWSKRLNLRANTSITLSKNFLVNLDMATIRLQRREPGRPSGSGGNRMLEDVFRVPPTILPKYPDKNGSEIYGQYVDIVNPLAYAEKGGYRQWLSDMASINIQPKWELFPGFNLKGQFSYRVNSDVVNERRDNFNFFDYYTEKLTRTWSVSRVNTPSRSSYYFLAGNADYTFTRNNHYFYAMAGYSMEQTNAEGWDVFSMVSGYAKLNYSYDDKYLLEATVRADGSSRFGPGNKFGYFPSAAVGWNVHKEAFLADSRVINNLKLRASYGLLGNENIGYYKYQTLINATTGLEEINGNANISWETVNMLDIGFDLGLFPGNRLELTLDYYNKITNDLIITPPISYVAGLAKVPVNAGKVKNNGWELAINYTEKLGKDLSLTLRPGVWYNKNEILELVGGPYVTASTNSMYSYAQKVGYNISAIYGYKTDGLLQASDFAADGTPLIPVISKAQPGDIKYVDFNNDKIIDGNDQTIIGNAVPKLNFSADIAVRYKNFDLEVLLQGTGQSDAVLLGMLANPLDMSFDGGIPTTYYSTRYWQPTRTDARFPRITTSPANSKLTSDFWFENAAYMRIKFAQFGYNLASNSLKRVGISNIRLYLNAQNPYTFSSLKIMDPESRGNQWTYPVMQMYTIGANVKF